MLEVVEHQQHFLILEVGEELGFRRCRASKTQACGLRDARSQQIGPAHRGQGDIAHPIVKRAYLFICRLYRKPGLANPTQANQGYQVVVEAV